MNTKVAAAILAASVLGGPELLGGKTRAKSSPRFVTPDDLETVARVKAAYPRPSPTEGRPPAKPPRKYCRRANVRNKFGRVEMVFDGGF